MNNICLGLLLAAGLSIGSVAQAASLKSWLPSLPKGTVDTSGLKKVYVGLGITNELVHVNAEVPTHFGNVYAKVGSFINGSSDVAGQLGFRYPYALNGTDKDGYYLGGFIGDIDTDRIDNKLSNRLGIGADISYVWSNQAQISAASLGIGFGEEKTDQNGKKNRSKPMILFGLTFNYGVF